MFLDDGGQLFGFFHVFSFRLQAKALIEVDDDQRYPKLLKFFDRLFGVLLLIIVLLPRRITASASLEDRHAIVIRYDHKRHLMEPCRSRRGMLRPVRAASLAESGGRQQRQSDAHDTASPKVSQSSGLHRTSTLDFIGRLEALREVPLGHSHL